jgi:TPR repeat protein
MSEATTLAELNERGNALEDQVLRHEAEISMCLVSSASAVHARREPGGEDQLWRLEQVVKSEQLYRSGQELLYGEHGVPKDVRLGLLRLRESAGLGHSNAALACGLALEAGKICDQNLEEAVQFYRVCADQGDAFGQ